MLLGIVLLLFLLVYPYVISRIIDKKITKHKEENFKIIFINIGKIILFSILSLIFIIFLLNIYEDLIPNSASYLCTDTGGFTVSCSGNSCSASVLLFLMEIIITIQHFLSLKFIFKIFEYSNGIFKYFFMYVYMIIIYAFSFLFLFDLYGLFVSIYYDFIFVEILRFLVLISPICLFIVSTIIYGFKSKN